MNGIQDDCIFCKRANGIIPTDMVYQNEWVAAFKDLNPQAPVHVLIVPKPHFESTDEICETNSVFVAAVFEAIPVIAKKLGVSGRYRIITNCGEDAGQSIKHLHFHLLAGTPELKERLI